MTRFLVVDDSGVIRKVARRMLETLGYAVDEAIDGEDALKACLGAMPDGVLLDWNMPNMDGLAFLEALRASPEGARPKVLFCTTENDVTAAKCISCEADGVSSRGCGVGANALDFGGLLHGLAGRGVGHARSTML